MQKIDDTKDIYNTGEHTLNTKYDVKKKKK